MKNRITSFYRRNHWRGRLIITLIVLSLLIIMLRVTLSPGIIYGTTLWLKEQGIDSTIEDIDIDIFNGTVSLINAVGLRQGKPLFNIGLVNIHWQWAPLSDKTIEISSVSLDSLSVNIKHYSDSLIIGGVSIPLAQSSSDSKTPLNTDVTETEENVTAWAATLGKVTFTNLNICYLQSAATLSQSTRETNYIDYCVELDKMLWTGTISYATDVQLLKTNDIPLSTTGDFTLNGLSVTDIKLNKKLLRSKSNTLRNVTLNGINNIRIQQLTMNELSLLQRDDPQHSDSIRFHQLKVDEIKLVNLQSLSINNINISKPGTYLVKQNETNWEYQQWLPHATISDDKATTDQKRTKDSASFKVALNNITINNSDLCYQNNHNALYYCLTFEDLSWQGHINYNTEPLATDAIDLKVKGTLGLSQLNIHNQTIDRDLLAFAKIKILNLAIVDTSNISLDSFKLDNLIALQRSETKNDSTVTFDELAINDFKYNNHKISVNSVELNGLTDTLSKNKNGGWEHDKWTLTKQSTGNKETPQAASPVKESQTLKFSLNKLNITTDKTIEFIDNSTQPVMKIGLQSLALAIDDIHTEKPDANSHFRLYAKTTRHGTIDIKGTVKPLAKKISFDLDGKLKGFDLRAATPATKKAIGHIIQSGQMDADLKLLAVNGVLDSNIALALYQFNIKATNKESAKKLDAKFGMPLNQTLVLLRDRDNSIHLDIPITGDVNNPEFEPMDVILKATTKAATVALITFYTPYGLVYAGGNVAFNLATALNFDPIDFKPGSSELLANNKEQLSGLSKLMVEKPNVHLTLCGVTNQQDAFSLFPELKKEQVSVDNDNPQNHAEITLTKEQSSQLKQLATTRQINTKNYLVQQYEIDHDRLILCAPEHNTDDDAIAGVEIII